MNPKGIECGYRNRGWRTYVIDYQNLINALLAEGITPYVTRKQSRCTLTDYEVYHWDFPQALEERYGGWRHKEDVLLDFERYADVCFQAFGDRVQNWYAWRCRRVLTIVGSLLMSPT